MIVPRVCFLVVLTLASIEFENVDATLVDLLNDVKNQLKALQKAQQEVQEEVQAGQKKIQKEVEEVQEEVQAGQKKIQKEVEEVQEEVQAMNNTIKVDVIKEKVDDINVKVDAILHHVSETDGTTTEPATTTPTLEPKPWTTTEPATTTPTLEPKPWTTTEQATITTTPTLEPKPWTTTEHATTTPTLEPKPMRELKFVGGTSGASSYLFSYCAPKDAFALNPEKGYGWLAIQKDVPAVVWYCFQEQHSPKNISFQPWYTDLYTGNIRRAQKFEFVGRVNTRAPWEVICEGTGYAEYKSMTEERGCDISTPIDRGFQCLGLRITQGTNGYCGLKRIRMWADY